jgi:Uma2 family endonuclease
MSVAVQKLTYQEYREMEFDDNDPYLYELLKGTLVKKSSPTLIHQRISRKLLFTFETYILQKKCGEIFYAPLDVVLDEENAPQPDLVYVSNENSAVLNEEELVIVGTPDLVIEILSPGTAKRDKTLKKDIYGQFGVKEYWLVDPGNKTIEVYTLQNNRYELFAFADAEENVKSALLPDLAFALTTIFN